MCTHRLTINCNTNNYYILEKLKNALSRWLKLTSLIRGRQTCDSLRYDTLGRTHHRGIPAGNSYKSKSRGSSSYKLQIRKLGAFYSNKVSLCVCVYVCVCLCWGIYSSLKFFFKYKVKKKVLGWPYACCDALAITWTLILLNKMVMKTLKRKREET